MAVLGCGRRSAQHFQPTCGAAQKQFIQRSFSLYKLFFNRFSRHTVADWYRYCREVCTIYLDRFYEQEGNIGGPGHIIEVDEMKIGRRKYNQGRIVEGVWLLGMIDVATNQIRLEFCPENKRDSNTLLMLIKKHVSEDSTIFTDCWKGYANLSKEGFFSSLRKP